MLVLFQSENGKLRVNERQFGAWYWIVVHGKHGSVGVEMEHFEMALEAIDLAAKYRPESAQKVREYALEGFNDFAAIQKKLFTEIAKECSEVKVLAMV